MSESATGSDLFFLKSSVTNNLATNGGKPTKIVDTYQLFNGLVIDPSLQTTGVKLLRKFFYGTKDGSTTDLDVELTLSNIIVACKEFDTPGFDVFFTTAGASLKEQFEATQANVPVNAQGYPTNRLYGNGYLTQSAALGSSEVIIDARRGELQPFQAGDLICFSRSYWQQTASPRWSITSVTGWYERVSATAVSYLGDVATIQLSQPLNHDIPKNSFVSVGLPFTDPIKNHTGEVTVTRGSGSTSTGSYNAIDNPIIVHPSGGVAQQWTLSFVSNFAFNLIGDTLGNVGGGNISGDFIPINPKNNKPYFTMPNAGFQGTWQAGDTITFYSFTQMIPVWLFIDIPANTAPNNNIVFTLSASNTTT